MKKRYEVKEKYVDAANALIGRTCTYGFNFVEGDVVYQKLNKYNVLAEFCEELPPEVDAWKEPMFRSDVRMELTDKAMLLIRMQSWADYHNKMDGFVADWGNDMQKKYGVVIEDRITSIQPRQTYNGYLFQICVGTESRAAIMHGYFRKDIQSLIDKGLI